MLSTDDLYDKALALSSDVDDNFLELARALRQLHHRDPDLFKQLIDKADFKRRKAYYLVNISRWFDGMAIGKSRLRKLGWTKLQIIGPHIHEGNAEELVELAEKNTAARLQALMKGEKPPANTHCVLMYFSTKDFEIVADALVKYGGVRTSRGVLNKEKALLRFIEAGALQPSSGTTSNQEKTK